MRYILTVIGVLTVLGVIANALGGIMWDMADHMPLWWESEDEE